MDAVTDYIVSHATNPVRVIMALFSLVFWIIAWFGGRKKEDTCTASAVGTIIRAKDEKWSILGKGFFGNDETPMREVVIRYRIGERDVTVTDKVQVPGRVGRVQIGGDEGYKGKRLGDKVTVYYNPNDPDEYILGYSGTSMHISPLMHVFIVLFLVAFILFVPISG